MMIKIAHLYPDMLNLYGDRGNIIALTERMNARGIEVQTDAITMGKTFNADDYDILFIGGGQDFEQDVLLEDLKQGKDVQIQNAIEGGKVMLAICGGYQMLGKYYKTYDGKMLEYMGALDFYTEGKPERMIGNYAYKTKEGIEVVGFENHSGRTYLGNGVEPLGKMIKGYGNNGEDGTEGVRYKNTFGTYSHGPVLPKNPQFADLLISKALENKYGKSELAPLDDTLEEKAQKQVMKLYIK
ncbi:MAG: glutamine amidotransferase [Eubacterium sp.]|nr:glutamine amidotransferase [Eubacterium sp.]MBR1530544.1 glutamine amidotransferase [Eubacterium sp.]